MKIATTSESTVWKCDRCDTLVESENAFHIPDGWWVANIQRRTEGIDYHTGKLKMGIIDACSKQCLIDAITYSNQQLIPYA